MAEAVYQDRVMPGKWSAFEAFAVVALGAICLALLVLLLLAGSVLLSLS